MVLGYTFFFLFYSPDYVYPNGGFMIHLKEIDEYALNEQINKDGLKAFNRSLLEVRVAKIPPEVMDVLRDVLLNQFRDGFMSAVQMTTDQNIAIFKALIPKK